MVDYGLYLIYRVENTAQLFISKLLLFFNFITHSLFLKLIVELSRESAKTYWK